MKINQKDKNMMEKLIVYYTIQIHINEIQSLLNRVALNNTHDKLNDWINSAEASISDLVKFHIHELLDNEKENK